MTTIISTSFRSRLKDANREVAAIEDDASFEDQDAFAEHWFEKIDAIEESDYVDGAGEHGIFSSGMLTQAAQFADDTKFWGISIGLGMIDYNGKYPQYDLGKFETSMGELIADGSRFISKIWWNALTEHRGPKLSDVILEAVNEQDRVVIAIPAVIYPMIRDDIEALIPMEADHADKDQEMDNFAEVKKYLRFVGPDLEETVHPEFLDCVMPWDKNLLSKVVPGARTNGARRMAFLLEKVCDVIGTDPADDFDSLWDALSSNEPAVYSYDVSAPTSGEATKYARLEDEEAIEIIKREYYTRCHGSPVRIARLMRNDGYHMTKDRVEELMAAPTPKKKSKPKGTNGSNGTGRKKKAPAKKKTAGGRRKRATAAASTDETDGAEAAA